MSLYSVLVVAVALVAVSTDNYNQCITNDITDSQTKCQFSLIETAEMQEIYINLH